MFVGATGPLVGGLVYRTGAEKLTKVATMAAALTGQHLLKGVVFAFVGFCCTPRITYGLLQHATHPCKHCPEPQVIAGGAAQSPDYAKDRHAISEQSPRGECLLH